MSEPDRDRGSEIANLKELLKQREAEVASLRRRVEVLEQGDAGLLDALLTTTPYFIYFKDASRRFVRASVAFEELFKRPLSEVIGLRDEDLFPPEVYEHTVKDDLQVIEGGEPVIDRLEGGEVEGEERWVSTTKLPWRGADGRVLGLLGMSRDITRIKLHIDAYNKTLHRRQRLEAIGRLAGGIAHDFNNILAIISAVASGVDEDHIEEDLQVILRATERGADLTRQLLMFSRQQPVAPHHTDVNACVRELSGVLLRLLPDDIVLHTALGAVEGRTSIGLDELQQILINLLLNSRDAMPQGGELHIETEARENDGRRKLVVTVRDTGRGMGPEVLEHIFEPFFSTQEDEFGAGLGLATVHGIIQRHGGALEVESEVGVGTTFRILLDLLETPR